MKVLLNLFLVLSLLLPAVLSQGFGCDENYLPDDERVDCGTPSTGEPECRAKNCTWCPTIPDAGIPWCYFYSLPSAGGYMMVGEPIETPNGVKVNLAKIQDPRRQKPLWDGEADTLTLEAEFQSDYRLRIKITDGTPRWEVPLQIRPASGGNSNKLYDITFTNEPMFSFKVTRKSSGTVLFDSSPGKFIFADQYLTLSWKVGSENVYGIGENEQHSFKHDFSRNTKWTLWGRDQPPSFTANMYGAQPYYTVLESDGNSHSVAVVNSNAQEFHMTDGGIIKYVTIGGLFDFYFFLGPTPENTVQQYTEMVGRAQMPPYWALGFQLCRYGYNSIENMKAAVDRTAQYDIPQDVQYGDIDIMERELDFTYSQERFPGLPEYIKELKTKGIKFMTILDPCISIGEPAGSYRAFDLGEQMDVWIRRADGTKAIGKVWPADPIYWPDYSNPATREWWIILIKEFHDLLEYDGLWIDMNEPANFVYGDTLGCPQSKYNNPPYTPPILGGSLADKTICPDHKQYAGIHYDTHSLYGWFQSEPTLNATRQGTGKRALVLSRSTFLGSGHWVAHWLGDNFSNWSNLHYSIIGMLTFNQFGVPFVGPDICGFIGSSNADMCQRWMELGAFYPFSRNHNGIGYADQDPGAFGPEVAASSRTALLIRYTLLPYLYTLFYLHNVGGDTVARSLWHVFPKDPNTVAIDRQFFWGTGLLVSPVLDEGATSVSAYFPASRFYSYYDGSVVSTSGTFETISAPKDFIPLHIHGGNILPTQEPAKNTDISRNNPMGLIVALDAAGAASGDLYFDDGDSIDPVEKGIYFHGKYTVSNRQLTSSVLNDGYAEMSSKKINTIRLLGATGVTAITVNGAPHTDFQNKPSGEVTINNLNLVANSQFTITF